GGPAALADVIAGHIPMMFVNIPAVLELHRTGRARVLAVADAERSPLLPDVPTMGEAGTRDVISGGWNGILVRSGTPRAIVDRIASELRLILEDPDFSSPLTAQGYVIKYEDPAKFAARIKRDYDSMGTIVKAAGIRVE